MLDFKKVDLSDKDILETFFKTEHLESSEFSFLCMLIWAEALQIHYAVSHDCIVFKFRDGSNPPSLRFPIGTGDKEKVFWEECEHFRALGHQPRFYGLEEFQCREIETITSDFTISPMENYYDYVYSVDDLIRLPGKKYHSKKNHLNSFIRNYSYEYFKATEDDAKEIMASYDAWLDMREDGNEKYLRCERNAISLLLNNISSLNLSVGALRVKDEICAFTLGEELNPDTVVIHTEKAFSDVRGAYAAINQMYLEQEWQNKLYVNREEDLGIEGLRKAKESYHPVKLIQKYKALTGE